MRSPRSRAGTLQWLLPLGLLAGCGGGGGGGGGAPQADVGELVTAPDGHLYFVDPNQGGRSNAFRLTEIFWGRLVNVHDVDAAGDVNTAPLFTDLVINENIQSDGPNYLLETNPITQQTRLVIKRQFGAPDGGNGTFLDLLEHALADLPPIIPKNDDGTAPEPFSLVSRNGCLVLRFDDLLGDDQVAAANLPETVKILSGYPAVTPFGSRTLFDPNHGGKTDGHFHSTRVLIDFTVSEAESAASSSALPLNSLGLPASLPTSGQPNVSVRVPARIDFGSGQFEILTNLKGSPLATTQNGPIDSGSPTMDIVRAMRSGNPEDTNNGFLLDLNRPEIIGGWPVLVSSSISDPAGTPGADFIVDLAFLTSCQGPPVPGDIISVSNQFVETTAPGSLPDASGTVRGVQVRSLTGGGLSSTDLLGSGEFLTTYDNNKPVVEGCWVTISPLPQIFPATGVHPDSQALIRFSEPMDPVSVSAFETFYLLRGNTATEAQPDNIVVGEISSSGDLKDFRYTPTLPLAHEQNGDPYSFRFGTLTDLAGNTLSSQPEFIPFSVDASAPIVTNGGIVLRLNDPNEIEVERGYDDLRGQFFYDLTRGIIKPRPVTFESFPADRTNPVPSIMIPFPPGIQTPLSPLGSKLHTVWRYADFGFQVRDETKFNLDVYGLNWSPVASQVNSDFYEEFEIRLAHSRKLPDECISNNLLPLAAGSGLISAPNVFESNILFDPLSPQKTMHSRGLGYLVDPSDLFIGATGTPFMPFPLNRDTMELITYTWRDTAILALGGPAGRGLPMCIEVGKPLFLENGPAGSIAPSGQVPSYGLPLLMEYRCYPSDSGVGLNSFDISLAVNSSARPNFRSYSTGGINRLGLPITKNPDLEEVPTGGFNPGSTPPGKKTKQNADNSFYVGQVDVVIRVSRVHTIWLEVVGSAPDYLDPILDPNLVEQPLDTQVLIDYRGAEAFSLNAGDGPFDARRIDPYGDLEFGSEIFWNNDATWTNNIDDVDGARYLQLRISFINNIESGLNAELDAIGIPFDQPNG